MIEEEKLIIIDYKKIQPKFSEKENFNELIKNAYRKLKHSLYFDKFPLNYREKLAQFESKGDLDQRLKEIGEKLYPILNNPLDLTNPYIDNLLNQISYTPYPKKITSPLDNDDEKGPIQLISNDRVHSIYQLESFELFFDTKVTETDDGSDAFVTLQIIAILWILHIGVLIDDDLDPSCYGSRVKSELKKNPDKSFYLYHRYFEKYTEWRDKAFKQAKYLLNKEYRDSLIISLDVTRFYYSVEINFEKISKEYSEETLRDSYPELLDYYNENRPFIENINKITRMIHCEYHKIITKAKILHTIIGKENISKTNPCLPIGLLSSGIIANWFLKDFDKELIRQYNPDYYGRYVDDLLIVIKASDLIKKTIKQENDKSKKIYQILEDHFSIKNNESNVRECSKSRVFKFSDNKDNHIYLNSFGHIENKDQKVKIKTDKIRLYYFNKDSSQVILNKLSKQLQQDASFFRFLPDDDWNATLDEVAYDIITKGSIQKIRNIVDVSENEYELVKYLSNLSIKYHFIDLHSDEIDQDIKQIFHFFSGVNIIKHNKLWERIFSILIICKRYKEICIFYQRAIEEIKKISSNSIITQLINKLIEDNKVFEKIESIITSQSVKDECEVPGILITEIEKKEISRTIEECIFDNSTYNSLVISIQNFFIQKCSKTFDINFKELNEIFLELTAFKILIFSLDNKIKNALEHNLTIALAIPSGLLTMDNNEQKIYFQKCAKLTKPELIEKQKIFEKAKIFRQTGLIRDQYLLYPLFNLIAPDNRSLIDFNDIYPKKLMLGKKSGSNLATNWNYPPKIYHVWEYLLLVHYHQLYSEYKLYSSLFDRIYEELCKKELINCSEEEKDLNNDECRFENGENDYLDCIIKKLSSKIKVILPKNINLDSPEQNHIIIEDYYFPNEKNSDTLQIGIAHLQISDENLIDNLDPLKSLNFSIERQKALYNLLNKAEDAKCDLVIFPELSIPIYWLPFMVSYSKRRQIGLVFGLEHWVVKDKDHEYAYNFTVTVLPYKENEQYHDCLVTIRNKNHYPSIEKEELEKFHTEVPTQGKSANYHLFHWRGASFTVFNCIELADINHKSLFKSKVDFLIAIEHNKDTKYYANIVDSICRDLHCYVIQVNVPQHGDSRVIQPKRSEIKDLATISRGNNSVLLTTSIEIKSLREFQIRNEKEKKCNNSDSFKPLPPGFDREQVLNRGKFDSNLNQNKANIWIKRTYFQNDN